MPWHPLSTADAAEGSCLTPELIAALPTTREGVVELQAHLTEQLEADAPLTDLHGRAALMHLPRCAALAQYGGGDDMRVAAPYVCEPLDARALARRAARAVGAAVDDALAARARRERSNASSPTTSRRARGTRPLACGTSRSS